MASFPGRSMRTSREQEGKVPTFLAYKTRRWEGIGTRLGRSHAEKSLH